MPDLNNLGQNPNPDNVTSMNVGGNLLTAGLQGVLNLGQMFGQRLLFDYQQDYNSPLNQANRLRAAGLTPAAIAQSLAGGAGNSGNIPVASMSAAPSMRPDLGSAFMDAKLKDAEIVERGEASKNLELQRFWNARLWNMQINESISRIFKNNNESQLFRSQSDYYNEFAKTLQSERPWKIETMKIGLFKLIQDIEESKSRVNLNKSAEVKNYQEAATQPFVRQNLAAGTEESYSRKFNIDQQGFALMWDNDLRSAGFNPNQNLWNNLGRLAFTKPQLAIGVLDNFGEVLTDLDNRAQSVLGENYKRNAAIGYGLYKLHQSLGNSKDRTLRRLNSLTGSIGNLMPFAHPQPVEIHGFRRY